VKKPPYGTRCLVISCHDPRKAQFSGIGRIAAELSRRAGGFAALEWQGGSLQLRRRRTLDAVIVSGHGAANRARLRAAGMSFTPECLQLPPQTRLFLLACYQGRPSLRRAWAGGAGIPAARVYGHDGETESSLSTCLFLHLLAEGLSCLEDRFEQWRNANRYLQPHFVRLRRLYAQCGGDPLATLNRLAIEVDLSPAADFIGICRTRPGYLRGLTKASDE
jgi:hypothetical protein